MMKRHFDVESDGFYGAYWKCKTGSDCAMIAMIGDDPEDYLARTSVKWLHKLGVNVMTMSPRTVSRMFASLQEKGRLVQGGTKRKSNWKIIR